MKKMMFIAAIALCAMSCNNAKTADQNAGAQTEQAANAEGENTNAEEPAANTPEEGTEVAANAEVAEDVVAENN